MKAIYKTLILSAGVIYFTSCSDFLDQSSPSEMNDETVFNNTYYTNLALNKVYGDLTQDQTYSSFLPIVCGLNTDCELVDGLGVDASNTSNERGCMNYNCSPGWSRLANVWDAMYKLIENTNLVIEGVEASPLLNPSEDTSEARALKKTMLCYRAEAKTLRAMVYLDLIRLFGDIPFKMERSQSDLSNAYLGKTDRDEIMDSLITDLEEIIPDLPWAGEDGYTTEHVTRGYAHGLLANIALTRAGFAIREKAKEGYIEGENSDPVYPTQRCDDETRAKMYKLAEQHLAAVINSMKHSLTTSVEEYWRQMNVCELQTVQPENLFEIPMMLNKSGELGYTVGFRVSGASSYFGLKGNSSGKLKLTAPYFWSFDHSGKDTRRNITCALSEFSTDKDTKAFRETLSGNKPFSIYCGKWDYRMMAGNTSWLEAVRAGDASAKICSGINVVKMRYPHVLLMYAEAVYENYKTESAQGVDADGNVCVMTAKDALLAVHKRAYADADKAVGEAFIEKVIADKGFMGAIMDENAWELAGEGVRKFDLIRWNELSNKIDEFKEAYKECVNLADQAGGYPSKVYYKYKTTAVYADREIDMNSINWYEKPSSTSGFESKDFWGKELNDSKGQKQLTINLPSISSGLNKEVKNRYLLPIASTTISTSNGNLYNSYGYAN